MVQRSTPRPPVVDTDGRRRFEKALETARQDGLAKQAIAERLGRSIQSVWAYANRTRRPDEDARKAIHRLFGIEPDAWMTAAEKRERARRRAWAARQNAAA
jgi:transcriptional regulator with XRE-family HTH domain